MRRPNIWYFSERYAQTGSVLYSLVDMAENEDMYFLSDGIANVPRLSLHL